MHLAISETVERFKFIVRRSSRRSTLEMLGHLCSLVGKLVRNYALVLQIRISTVRKAGSVADVGEVSENMVQGVSPELVPPHTTAGRLSMVMYMSFQKPTPPFTTNEPGFFSSESLTRKLRKN